MFTIRTIAVIAVILLFAFTSAYAVQGQRRPRKKPGILQPQMTPNKGSYDQPAGRLGQTPSTPWSASTIAAAVDGKPLEGSIITVVGEIIDYSCYLQLGKHGEKHRDCAQKCFKSGQPIGLLAKDGSIYLLMEEEHNPRRDGLTNLREKAIDMAGDIVEVTGTFTKVDNQKALYVTGLVTQK
jgi:hypothetical protein